MERAGRKICRVRPGTDGRRQLKETVGSGKGSKTRRRRARALPLADGGRPGGGMAGREIARAPGTGVPAVGLVRRQCAMEGLEAALERRVRANRKKRVPDGGGEAKLTMPACPTPPGHAQWTLKPPGERLAELEAVESISRETVRQTLPPFHYEAQDRMRLMRGFRCA